jgi:hypothetical protein
MKVQKFELVKFQGNDIVCPVKKDEVYVAIRPICEALGLSLQPQTEKLKNDAILSRVVTIINTTGKDGKFYDMTCIPMHFLNGWLFTIDENKVKPEAREKLIAYKLECYKVLHHHFFIVPKKLEAETRSEYQLIQRNKEIDSLVRDIDAAFDQTKEGKERAKLKLEKKNNIDKISNIRHGKFGQLGLFEEEENKDNPPKKENSPFLGVEKKKRSKLDFCQ